MLCKDNRPRSIHAMTQYSVSQIGRRILSLSVVRLRFRVVVSPTPATPIHVCEGAVCCAPTDRVNTSDLQWLFRGKPVGSKQGTLTPFAPDPFVEVLCVRSCLLRFSAARLQIPHTLELCTLSAALYKIPRSRIQWRFGRP